jgi:transcriptional antiterminator RfaH
MLGWYVLHSKPQKEQWLYKQLNALNIDVYYPCLNTKNEKLHLCSVKPYFPRYLFVNVDLKLTGISMLQWIPGSLGLVSFGGEPACVPEVLLQRIRHRVDEINNAANDMLSGLKPGDEVVIHSGPFAGYDAIFCSRLRDSERVQVFLRVLQDQRMKIDLQVSQIRVAKQNRSLL